MGAISEKLVYLNGTKQAIKQAINEDFEVIDDNTTFREYAEEISSNNAKYKNLIPKETTNATNTLDISNSSGLDKALVTQYGNTYQEGEPTPDTPQEIVNISGKSTLKAVGKNLNNGIDYKFYIDSSATHYRVSGTDNGVCIEVDGTSNYTISTTTTQTRYRVACSNSLPTTTQQNCYKGNNKDGTSDNIIINTTGYNYLLVNATDLTAIQVEKDSTASTYEAYKEQSYDLDLKSKNLFDKDNPNILHTWFLQNTTTLPQVSNNDTIVYIPCQPNTTYTCSKMLEPTSDKNTCVVGTTSVEPNFGVAINQAIGWQGGTTTQRTITTTNKDKYLLFFCHTLRGTISLNDMLASVQIEVGSIATKFEPFYDINLCKIDTYKDRIYPLNGKWYLEKKINKVVLDGSESWSLFAHSDSTDMSQLYTNVTNAYTPTENEEVCIASHFKKGKWNSYWARGNEVFLGTSGRTGQLWLTPYGYTTASDFKTWLSNNDVIVYYVLATPTTEEITESNYPTLYNQLNNIKLFEGVNHITMTNESGLDVEFDIEYYKDWKLD